MLFVWTTTSQHLAFARICVSSQQLMVFFLIPFVGFGRTSKNAQVAMIDLTKQAAVHPSKQPRDQPIRFIKLKPSQRAGLSSSTLSSTFVPATSSGARLTRPAKRQPFKTSAPSWRGDQISSGDSSDASSEDSDDSEDNGRQPQHHANRGVGRSKTRAKPAFRNMLRVCSQSGSNTLFVTARAI